jgi:hypothetical protein
VLLTPAATLRSPIATAPVAAAMTLVAQLGRRHRQERRQPPGLEVHADRPRRWWVAELYGAGERGEHDAVGVLGGLMSVAARMRNGAPRLTMSTADGIGGSVSQEYGGAPSR